MAYKTIVCDPPWPYNRKWDKGSNKSAFNKKYNQEGVHMGYKTMSLDEIKGLPVRSLSAANCELYLWTTQKYLPNSFEVIQSWGFKYCQTLTWCKKPMGTGQGGVFCPTTEFLILARIGKMPNVARVNTTWWQVKRQATHSRKPECFLDLIETVTEAPRLEMFARRHRNGWDAFGDEIESTIKLESFIK